MYAYREYSVLHGICCRMKHILSPPRLVYFRLIYSAFSVAQLGISSNLKCWAGQQHFSVMNGEQQHCKPAESMSRDSAMYILSRMTMKWQRAAANRNHVKKVTYA